MRDASGPRPPGSGTFLKSVALFAASVLASLLLAELALRVAGIGYPQWYVEDPDLGGRLRPGAEGWFHGEGKGYVRVNSAGMRDREHALAKPAGALRIAVLGDSFAEAMPVSQDQAFWSVLERRLRECPALRGRIPEVLNFGVSGYGTAQELIMLRRHVWQYDPDIVLLAFFTGNDVRNNSRALNREDVPYFVLKEHRLVLDDSFRGRLRSLRRGGGSRRLRAVVAAARNHSRLLQLATHAGVALRRREAVESMAAGERRAAAGAEAGIDSAVYSPPRDERWTQAWDVTEALIAEMSREVRARGRQFWVVTLSTGIQVHPDATVRRTFARREGIADLFYPDYRIAALCEREGIHVITLAPAMADFAERNKTCLHGFPNGAPGFGHWNETGNRLAGELIAARLCAALCGPLNTQRTSGAGSQPAAAPRAASRRLRKWRRAAYEADRGSETLKPTASKPRCASGVDMTARQMPSLRAFSAISSMMPWSMPITLGLVQPAPGSNASTKP